MGVLRVLIIDRDERFRRFAEEALAASRYAPSCFPDFEEAFAALRRYRGQAVILSGLSRQDGASGLSFLTRVLEKYPHVPFLFAATDPPLESVIEALKQGAYDFLRKPVAPDILGRAVGRAVERLNLALDSERQDRDLRSQLGKARQELQQARSISAYKGFLISTAAHDFRSILMVLDGYNQILAEKCRECGREGTLNLIEQTRRSVARLRMMASTLLDFEAADRGEIRMVVRRVSLPELLGECAEFYRPYGEQKQVRMVLEEGIPDVFVQADPDRVMEVLDNLIYNALKFTPSGGRVTIGAGRGEAGEATVFVEDTGIGIPKSELPKLFTETRIPAAKDGNARVGLGLSICRKLLEAQGGRIWVESEQGRGTKVYFSLPLS